MSQKLSVTTSNARRKSPSRSWQNLGGDDRLLEAHEQAVTEAYGKLESLACVKEGTLGYRPPARDDRCALFCAL